MGNSTKASQNMPRTLGAVFTLAFGVFNFISGVIMILAGTDRFLMFWLAVLLVLLGATMALGGILVLTGKAQAKWKRIGYVMVGLSLALTICYFFMRGINWSVMLSVAASILYLSVSK